MLMGRTCPSPYPRLALFCIETLKKESSTAASVSASDLTATWIDSQPHGDLRIRPGAHTQTPGRIKQVEQNGSYMV